MHDELMNCNITKKTEKLHNFTVATVHCTIYQYWC